MSRIRSRDNKATELALLSMFRRSHIVGWRRHIALGLEHQRLKTDASRRRTSKRVKPDFVFRHCRLAVFVDGCFWHGCPRHAGKPKSNAEFWQTKLAANLARDRRVTTLLRRARWRVLRIWEHQLVDERQVVARVRHCIALGQPKKPTGAVPPQASTITCGSAYIRHKHFNEQ
jgi:DNA mismatch endonuclease (patch repair protein)